jgi:hypothetical protein
MAGVDLAMLGAIPLGGRGVGMPATVIPYVSMGFVTAGGVKIMVRRVGGTGHPGDAGSEADCRDKDSHRILPWLATPKARQTAGFGTVPEPAFFTTGGRFGKRKQLNGPAADPGSPAGKSPGPLPFTFPQLQSGL